MAANMNVFNPEKELAADINEFFRELFSITEKELRNPNKTKIHQFYNIVLIELGIEVTQVIQLQMEQINYLNGNMDTLSELIPFINLVEAIKCLQIPQFKDFNIFHILNPMPKPTVKYMRLMMNFIHFVDQIVSLLNPKFRRVVDAKQNQENLIEHRNNLKDFINQRAAQLKNDEIRLANVDSEIESKSANLNELNIEREKWQEEYEKVKAEYTKMKEIHDKQLKETHMIENDLREFQNRLKGHKSAQGTSEGSSQLLSIDVLKLKASNLQDQTVELRQQLTTRQLDLDFKLKLQDAFPLLKAKLEEVVELFEQKRIGLKNQSRLSQKITEIEDSLKSLESTYNNLISEWEKCTENSNGLSLKWSLEESSLKEALNDISNKNKSASKKFSELMVQRIELDKELEVLNRNIRDNEEKFKTITDHCNEKYQADRKKVKEWEKKLIQQLESGNSSAEKKRK